VTASYPSQGTSRNSENPAANSKPCKAENIGRGSSFSVPIDLIGGGHRWPDAPKLNPKLTAVILQAEIGVPLVKAMPMTQFKTGRQAMT
jgi:hypothetical protein